MILQLNSGRTVYIEYMPRTCFALRKWLTGRWKGDFCELNRMKRGQLYAIMFNVLEREQYENGKVEKEVCNS